MANKFLNSAGGNVSPYETSADAATTLSGLLLNATVALDEIIWAKNDSITVESSSAYVVLTSEGATYSHPLRVLCAGDWDDSPSTLSIGSKITTTGNYSISIVGAWLFYGITFNPTYSGSGGTGSVTNICNGVSGPHTQFFNNCTFVGFNSSASKYMSLGSAIASGTDPCYARFDNCTLQGVNANNTISIVTGVFDFYNLTVTGTATPAYLFTGASHSSAIICVADSDLSTLSIGTLLNPSAGFAGTLTFCNCKFHTSTTITGTWLAPGGEVLIINCDSGDTYTHHARHGYEGTWAVLTSIYATTDPADMSAGTGDTYSILMSASANVSRHLPLYSQWVEVWNDGTAYTPAIEVLVQGDGAAALLSDELWIEVDYNSGTDSPLGTRLTTCPDLLTAGSTVTAGTTAWTGDGYSTERTHKLNTTAVTPDKPGYIKMRVALAKPSSAVYVNPPR